MRRFQDGTYAEVHSLSCDFCEDEDWGYTMVRGRTPQAVLYPPLSALSGVCPQCFEGLGEDWDNAEIEERAAIEAWHAGKRDAAAHSARLTVDWTENGDGLVLDTSTSPARIVGTHSVPPGEGNPPDATASAKQDSKETR